MSVTTLVGKNVVITGAIPGLTRADATALLSQHGAHVQKGITNGTDVLIFGNNVGKVKTDKARAKGIEAIPWVDAEALMQGVAVQPTAPPTAAPTRNQPVPAQQGYRQVNPMLCKAADEVPTSGDWFYEMKWDGYRAIAHVNGDTQLASRAGLDFNRFENIKNELDQLQVACILDGEIVSLDDQGRSEFWRLHKGELERAKFMVFDLLAVQRPDPNPDRELLDIRNQPLQVRRELLSKILSGGVYVTESPLFGADEREALIQYAQENVLEGIVAKRTNSIYKEGARNDNWLKIKFRLEQEFVVLGWTEGEGRRAGNAGSFRLGVNEGTKTRPKWVHVGDAGSGGTDEEIRAIRDSLTPMNAPTLPYEHKLPAVEVRKTTWVEPTVVLQVRFQKWTPDGKIFHASIQGVRDDKTPIDVKRAA